MGQAHHLSAAVLVLKSCSKQASLLRCLVKIESAFEINNIPRGRVTRVAERIFSWAGLHIFGRDSVAQITFKRVGANQRFFFVLRQPRSDVDSQWLLIRRRSTCWLHRELFILL